MSWPTGARALILTQQQGIQAISNESEQLRGQLTAIASELAERERDRPHRRPPATAAAVPTAPAPPAAYATAVVPAASVESKSLGRLHPPPASSVRLTQLDGDSLLLSRAQGDELDLLATELDLELIAGFQAQLGGVGLADHQVARGIYMPLLLLNANLIAMSQTKEVSGQRHRFDPSRFC